MNKVVEIRKALIAFLKTKHPRVYYEVASDDVTYPYLIYDFPNSNDDGSMEQFVMDIDGWDAPTNGSTIALEELMALVDGDGDRVTPTGLHRKTICIEGLSMTFYRENRIPLKDDDKRLRRRKYVYQVRTHVSK